jgi:hypothetical protein
VRCRCLERCSHRVRAQLALHADHRAQALDHTRRPPEFARPAQVRSDVACTHRGGGSSRHFCALSPHIARGRRHCAPDDGTVHDPRVVVVTARSRGPRNRGDPCSRARSGTGFAGLMSIKPEALHPQAKSRAMARVTLHSSGTQLRRCHQPGAHPACLARRPLRPQQRPPRSTPQAMLP